MQGEVYGIVREINRNNGIASASVVKAVRLSATSASCRCPRRYKLHFTSKLVQNYQSPNLHMQYRHHCFSLPCHGENDKNCVAVPQNEV